jgi:hypothetical protein
LTPHRFELPLSTLEDLVTVRTGLQCAVDFYCERWSDFAADTTTPGAAELAEYWLGRAWTVALSAERLFEAARLISDGSPR